MKSFTTRAKKPGYRNVFYFWAKNRYRFALHNVKQFDARLLQVTLLYRSFGVLLWG